MIKRLYVEKRSAFATQAKALRSEIALFLGIIGLRDVRILHRYDVEGVSDELFELCTTTVFAEPQVDLYYQSLSDVSSQATGMFAVEYLPGQFDQRADSCEQCIQLIGRCERPRVRTATIYLLDGELTQQDIQAIKTYLINPVESREASLEAAGNFDDVSNVPDDHPLIVGFRGIDDTALEQLHRTMGLAMDDADLRMLRDYFTDERRDPTLTELKVIDTYWSDHCRHTTFRTSIDSVRIEDDRVKDAWNRYIALRTRMGASQPPTLMDIATRASKYLQESGIVRGVDISEEINACTIQTAVDVDGEIQDWLVLFKNETHNHPTEIEPFGGAATCIGGAIRDPLSGRGYVYQAMRISGSGDPRTPMDRTLTGKLAQRQIALGSAAGYSSYGNQIGLATGIVEEIYHPGYVAKHLELGAVIGAAPASHVRRAAPQPGDVVVLLGGRTGRDGCGGATGSSKRHDDSSLTACGAEVQKGNAPEERKLQRLFRNREAARMIKRCNDFGAGGVSVAIGELASGLSIDLDAVPKKYAGLDSTEIAISESQERMAVVLNPEDVRRFSELAANENLEATVVATVTADRRLRMHHRGRTVVDIDRGFLDRNGAEKHVAIAVPSSNKRTAVENRSSHFGSIEERLKSMLEDLNVCSKQGLSSRFDSTIGAGTVLMPFGGTYQKTPSQAMVAKLPVLAGETQSCSTMAWGFDPYLCEQDPYTGAYLSVVHSLAKLAATGADPSTAYLSLQEYFGRPGRDPERWGQPLAALLGAFDAQMDFNVAAIGGKDSMSGSFGDLDVPPTLVSFAVSIGSVDSVVSQEFKCPGSFLVLLRPDHDGTKPVPESFRKVMSDARQMMGMGIVRSAWALSRFGLAEALVKMSLGNRIGVVLNDTCSEAMLFEPEIGSLLLEVSTKPDIGLCIGKTTESWTFSSTLSDRSIDLLDAQHWYEGSLESVYPLRCSDPVSETPPTLSYRSLSRYRHNGAAVAKPRVLIPVFPGTNCEYESSAAFKAVGAETNIFVIRNLNAAAVLDCANRFAQELANSQILFIPGGFSGGDEPDGSGKFIAAFLRNSMISDAVEALLHRQDGLILGICNGFQALIKLGLVPFGTIKEMDEHCPTLTFNTIGRHQSSLVATRVASTLSPWLMHYSVGERIVLPISHGEGRFVCESPLLSQLIEHGQIATQYVDAANAATMDISCNPNGSTLAVEGITSPDGRVFGRMAHAERIGRRLYANTDFTYDDRLFRGAVDYFRT